MVHELDAGTFGMELDHFRQVLPDVLKSHILEFRAAFGTGMVIEPEVHGLAFGADARQHAVLQQMGFHVVKIKVLVSADHLLVHRLGIIAQRIGNANSANNSSARPWHPQGPL